MRYTGGINVEPRDCPCRVDAKGMVPWIGPVPAPGTSNVMKVPSRARTYPWATLPESVYGPVIVSWGVIALPIVPWPEPVRAPGTSNVTMAVFRSLAFAEKPNPGVPTLTVEHQQEPCAGRHSLK